MTASMIIGIDPDCSKSGVAFYEDEITVKMLGFFELYDFLLKNKDKIKIVIVESSWLVGKSNWHSNPKQSKFVGETIAKKVGANHETGRKIVEMCEYLGIRYTLQMPLGTKNINSVIFKSLTGIKSSNQDMRDAYMIVYNYIKSNKK